MTEKLDYILMNPSGNITLLCITPVEPKRQPAVAEKLMELEPVTEQVGFLSFSEADGANGYDIALSMAGGEFCGNATMSAAVYYCMCRKPEGGTVTVRVSGAEHPLAVTIESVEDGVFKGTVGMPGPLSVSMVSLPLNGEMKSFPVVKFPGISHVLAESYELGLKSEAERLVTEWCEFLGAEALGILFLNSEDGTMDPLVYVPAAGTLIWESACGSGTAAVGAWLAWKRNGENQEGLYGGPDDRIVNVSLKQPGGVLDIAVDSSGRLTLTGTMRIMRKGTME